MARISDTIASFINTMIDEDQDNEIVIQRNELANRFNCAPSQINYVLTTRFTCEKGYIIDSRRGGGGYIIIKKIYCENKTSRIKSLIDSIGNSLTYQSALYLLDHLLEGNYITESEFSIIKIAISDRTLVSVEDKNKVRADMLKGMITVILS